MDTNVLQVTIGTWQGIAGLAIIVFSIGGAWFSLKSDVKYLKNDLEDLDDDFKDMRKDIARMDKGFLKLNTTLMNKGLLSESCYSEAHSPRQLNDLGKLLYERSGMKALLENESYLERLFVTVSEYKPQTDLDIETFAFQALLDHSNDVEMRTIKDFVYNNPKFEGKSLVFTDAIHVGSLELRNKYQAKFSRTKVKETE